MSKTNIISIPFHIGDYQKATRGFDATEHGAYFLLLMELYSNGGSIPHDSRRLQRVCAVFDNDIWQQVEPVILAKCIVSGGVISNAKVVKVLSEIEKRSRNAATNAKKRWKKKPNKNNGRSMQTHSGRNANQNQNHIKLNKGDEGTPRRRLFEIISASHTDGAWASWFEKSCITETEVFAFSEFAYKHMEQTFGMAIEVAGFTIKFDKERATA